MDAARVRSIASLRRGLEVFALVCARGGISLRELHAASGVPKASLLRILKTLMEQQCVRRRDADGAYLVAGNLRLAGQPAAPQRSGLAAEAGERVAPSASVLADAVASLLAGLRPLLSWPSDVAVPCGTLMRVIDSNRAGYGRVWRPSVIGEQVDMLESAMGRAYLAFSPPDVSQPLIDALLADGGTRARRREALARELLATRQRGFGARDHFYAGPDTHHGRQLSAVAVPIMASDRVAACVSCVWSMSTSSRAEVIEHALAHLVRGAVLVGARLPT